MAVDSRKNFQESLKYFSKIITYLISCWFKTLVFRPNGVHRLGEMLISPLSKCTHSFSLFIPEKLLFLKSASIILVY